MLAIDQLFTQLTTFISDHAGETMAVIAATIAFVAVLAYRLFEKRMNGATKKEETE